LMEVEGGGGENVSRTLRHVDELAKHLRPISLSSQHKNVPTFLLPFFSSCLD
jgi:hypothetical protein